jgi:hypothetical protein
MNRGSPVVRSHVNLGWNCDLAVDSVNAEHAMHLHAGLSLHGDRAFHSIGTKRNLRILFALEHFPMHLAIAHAAAALAALGVDYDLS